MLVAAAVVFGSIFFAERLNELASGRDASFFYRFTGPMLVAFDMFRNHPWAGAGLTGEPFIANQVHERLHELAIVPGGLAHQPHRRRADQLFLAALDLSRPGLGRAHDRGGVGLAAPAGVPSVLYCWAVWIILGQASGSYVGPKTWTVMLIAAAASILAVNAPEQQRTSRPTAVFYPNLRYFNSRSKALAS